MHSLRLREYSILTVKAFRIEINKSKQCIMRLQNIPCLTIAQGTKLHLKKSQIKTFPSKYKHLKRIFENNSAQVKYTLGDGTLDDDGTIVNYNMYYYIHYTNSIANA